MSKLNVLLLGWEFSPAIREEQETSCYYIAKALAERVDLSVLLPHTDPNFILNNAEFTGLDQLDLQEIQTNSSGSRPSPYAEEAYIRNDIPLYGSGNSDAQSEGYVKPESFQRTVSGDAFTQNKPVKSQDKGVKPINIFGYKEFESLSLDAQVIEYARYTSRWANQKNIDIIYAYNYRTFLAGTELKLVTGKNLILQVDSLSYERSHPNSKGWMYELEKQAFQKCDYILTNTNDTAAILVNNYGISPSKIESLEGEKGKIPARLNMTGEAKPDNLKKPTLTRSAANQGKPVITNQGNEETDWQLTSDAIWEVIQMVAST